MVFCVAAIVAIDRRYEGRRVYIYYFLSSADDNACFSHDSRFVLLLYPDIALLGKRGRGGDMALHKLVGDMLLFSGVDK